VSVTSTILWTAGMALIIVIGSFSGSSHALDATQDPNRHRIADGDRRQARRLVDLSGFRQAEMSDFFPALTVPGEKMARRTGRFPQLVDSRSSVNGLLSTGSPRFREIRHGDGLHDHRGAA
jgi:hypothetical protein